jgi:hypothetical protein
MAIPYDDPAVINSQTGRFRSGWHVAEEPRYDAGGDSVSGALDNSDPKATDIRIGTGGYRARIRNHGHSCFLCEIVIRSQFHTTYEPEA